MSNFLGIHFSGLRASLFLGETFCWIISLLISTQLEKIIYKLNTPTSLTINPHFFYMAGIFVIILFIADAYNYQNDYCNIKNLLTVILAMLLATGMALSLFYVRGGFSFSHQLILLQAGTFLVLGCAWRYLFSALMFTTKFFKRTLIVGAGGAGRRLLEIIREHPRCGLLPVGLVDDDPAKVGSEVEGVPVLGTSADLPALIQKEQISLVVMAITHEKQPHLINRLIQACWHGVTLTDMPSVYEAITGKVPTSHITSEWLFQWNINSTRLYYRYLKRLLDLVLATTFFLATLPLFFIIAAAIKLDSPGPVFFRQERLGMDRRPFRIFKFRTMFHTEEPCSQIWTEANDPRLTRVGRFIRQFRLDELPQVSNVFRGEMSFIGPRPLVHCEHKASIPYYNYRFLVRPGITGWAQVCFPHGLAEEDTLEKVMYDIYYIKNLSFMLDMVIFLKTIRIILFRYGR